MNKEDFALTIEKIKHDTNSDYLDSIMLFCEQNSLELEPVAELVLKDPVLYKKIQHEAAQKHLLKNQNQGNTLPVEVL